MIDYSVIPLVSLFGIPRLSLCSQGDHEQSLSFSTSIHVRLPAVVGSTSWTNLIPIGHKVKHKQMAPQIESNCIIAPF